MNPPIHGIFAMMPGNNASAADLPVRKRPNGMPWKLGLFFGCIAFFQSVADPSDGLLSQATLSVLRRNGRGRGETTDLAALIAIPWLIKPLFGLISDSLPILGSRRKSYLVLSAFVVLLGFFNVYASLVNPGHLGFFLGGLVLATAGVAFSDVVSDALMIEAGQPRGLTGRFQSIQWSSTYAALILSGLLGGWLNHGRADKTLVAICAGVAMLLLIVSAIGAKEPPRAASRQKRPKEIVVELAQVVRARTFLAVAAFLFLWNFNPFTFKVLQLYVTEQMKLGEDFFGLTKSLFAVACLAGSVAYGFYCRRFSMRWLIHASILLGVMQTAAYWGLVGQKSAIVVTIVAGFAYMTGTLIQLDLAARICPPEVAGTAFMLLMSLENLATTASDWAGGRFYDWWGQRHGEHAAFLALVAMGVATTAASALLVPFMPLREMNHDTT